MNKATRTSLHAMRKAELIDFTWNLIQHYNEISREKDFLEGIAKTRWARNDGEPTNCWDDRMFLLHKMGDWNSKLQEILDISTNPVHEIWNRKDFYAESFANNWVKRKQ